MKYILLPRQTARLTGFGQGASRTGFILSLQHTVYLTDTFSCVYQSAVL